MTLRERFISIVAGVAVIFALYAWFREKPVPPTPPQPIHGELQPVPTSKPTGTMRCPEGGIVVVSGPTLSSDTSPDWVKDIVIKDKEYPIASGIVKPWGGDTHVWTYMNLQTGKSRMVFEQQPFEVKPTPKEKFLEWINVKEIGAFYGYGTDGRDVQIYGQWDLLRTGSIYWRAKVEANIHNNKTDSYLLVGGAYQWK